MGAVAAIGEATRVGALALAGVRVVAAEDEEQVRAAWGTLPDDVAIVVLTPAAAAVAVPIPPHVLTAVMPP